MKKCEALVRRKILYMKKCAALTKDKKKQKSQQDSGILYPSSLFSVKILPEEYRAK
jgi:hypothetical protein